MMTAVAPSELARTLLQLSPSVVGASATADWGSHVSKMPDTPDKAIAIFDTGGFNPHPSILLDYQTVQIRVRGNANDNTGTYQKARDVKDRLLGIASQNVGSDRVVSVTMIGDINFIGRDANDRPEYTLNWRMIIEPGTSSLSNRVAL